MLNNVKWGGVNQIIIANFAIHFVVIIPHDVIL